MQTRSILEGQKGEGKEAGAEEKEDPRWSTCLKKCFLLRIQDRVSRVSEIVAFKISPRGRNRGERREGER